MPPMLLSGVLCLVILTGLGLYTKNKIPAWNERGFGDRGLDWSRTAIASLVGGAVLGLGSAAVSGQWYVGAVMTILGYFGVLATATDLSVLKIPSDISIVAYLLPIPLILLWWPQMDKLSLAFWAVVVGMIFLLAVFSRGMGFADVRILFLTLTGLSWWVGVIPMTYALMGACVLQIVLTLVLPKTSFGVVKAKGTQTVVNKSTGELEGGDPYEKDVVAASEEPIMASNDVSDAENVDGLPDRSDSDSIKKRRHTPFGPALLIAFTAVAIYAIITQDQASLNLSNSVLGHLFV